MPLNEPFLTVGLMPGTRASVGLVFFGLILNDQTVARFKLQRALAETQLSLRKGNFNSRLPKQSLDAIVEVAANLCVQAWPVGPHEKSILPQPVAETSKLHSR